MKKLLNFYVAPILASALIYVISLTLRVYEEGKEIEKRLETEGKPIIYAFWHGRLFAFPHYYKNRRRYKILVSPSADGEIIARTLAMFGFGIVRGSSFKSATKALLALKRYIDEGFSTVLIADGSRGPIYELQPGALMLSKLTGNRALPMTASFSSYWTLPTWDRLMIPKPFAKMVVIYGEPIFVPADADSATMEEKRREMETTLREITNRADTYFVRTPPGGN